MGNPGIKYIGHPDVGQEFRVFGASVLVRGGHYDVDDLISYLANRIPVPGNGKSYEGLMLALRPSLQDQDTRVGPGLDAGQKVTILEGANIGANVKIGDDVEIEADVTIGGRTRIQSRVFVGRGNVIPSDCVIESETRIPSQLLTGNDDQTRQVQRYGVINNDVIASLQARNEVSELVFR